MPLESLIEKKGKGKGKGKGGEVGPNACCCLIGLVLGLCYGLGNCRGTGGLYATVVPE